MFFTIVLPIVVTLIQFRGIPTKNVCKGRVIVLYHQIFLQKNDRKMSWYMQMYIKLPDLALIYAIIKTRFAVLMHFFPR